MGRQLIESCDKYKNVKKIINSNLKNTPKFKCSQNWYKNKSNWDSQQREYFKRENKNSTLTKVNNSNSEDETKINKDETLWEQK